jgi:hypothetical protein
MQDVIAHAHGFRYKAAENDPKKDSIVVSEHWMAELNKHPYFSSKHLSALTR